MEFWMFLLAFSMFCELATSIRCYKCNPIEDSVQGTRLCTEFSEEDAFVGNCPNSTMCFKKQVSYTASGVTTINFWRGCALQSEKDQQRKVRGKWEYYNEIHEVYEETCSEDPRDVDKLTKTINCYCRGDLCNGGAQLGYSITSIALIVFVFSLS